MIVCNMFNVISVMSIISLAIYFLIVITIDILEIREHEKYINSIKVGDVFEINHFSKLESPNPFNKRIEYTFTKCVITDIKEDIYGFKWVKYKCLKSNAESSCKLASFVEDYTRIEKK